MTKIRPVDGSTHYEISYGFGVFRPTDGVVEVPDEVAAHWCGTGLYERVEETPKGRGRGRAAATETVPEALETADEEAG